MDQDNLPPEDVVENSNSDDVQASETQDQPNDIRFVGSVDVTPVFNSSVEAVDRLSRFVENATTATRPAISDSLNLLSTTDGFHKFRDQTRDEMVRAFRDSDDFKQAALNWPEMDADARVKMLNRVSDLQGRVYGYKAPRVVPFYERPDNGDIFHGRFNPELDVNGVLEVNIHPMSKFSTFQTALEMVMTQNNLAWLDKLADSYDHGGLTEGNPMYEQARVLSIYRGIIDVLHHKPVNDTELGGFFKNASADMAEGMSLEILTETLQGTRLDLRRNLGKPSRKGTQPG